MSNDRAADHISTLQRVLLWVLMLLMPVAVAFLAWTAAVMIEPDWGSIGRDGVDVPSETTFWVIVGSAFGLAALVAAIVLSRLPSSQEADRALMFDDLVFCPECNLRTAPDTGECQFCDAWLDGARKITDPEPEADADEVAAAAATGSDDEAGRTAADGDGRPSWLGRLAFWRKPDDGGHDDPEVEAVAAEEPAGEGEPEPDDGAAPEPPDEPAGAEESEEADEPGELEPPEETDEVGEPEAADEPETEPPRPPIPPPEPPPAPPDDPWAAAGTQSGETSGELRFDLEEPDEGDQPGPGSGA